MANPLYGQFGNQQMNPMAQLVAEAKRLQQTMTGNPKQMVEELMRTGKMSQTQFDNYAQIANQIIGSGVFK